jgi:hypothetical protein
MLCLQKLHKTLEIFTPYESGLVDVVALIRYTYSNENTPDRDGEMDQLRELVSKYVTHAIKTMSKCQAFLDLVEEGGPFIRDIWALVLSRIR